MKLLVWLFKWLYSMSRSSETRRREREFNEGKRCVSCERTDTHVEHGRVTCQLCGHSEVLVSLASVRLSDAEIFDVSDRNHNRYR